LRRDRALLLARPEAWETDQGVAEVRHRHRRGRLNLDRAHHRSVFRNMSVSLFEHGQIKTTLPKAKELRRHAEPLITLAKVDSPVNRRRAFDLTRSKKAVGILFNDLGKRFQNRPGGYLRILKCGFRPGDQAPMAYVQLVEDESEEV